MSARDIIKQAFETEFDDTYSGDAFADKCVTVLHEAARALLGALPDAIRALNASPAETEPHHG